MDVNWRNDNFDFTLVDFNFVYDFIDELVDRLYRAIALPVSSDDEFSVLGLHS